MALNPGNDREHDESLAKLYRAAATEASPARLDAAIRAAARREAGAGPRPLSRRRAWRVPVSLAAMLVLSATLVLMMREEGADRLEADVAPAQRPAAEPDRAPEPQARAVEARPPASPSKAPQSRVLPPVADVASPAPLAVPQTEQKMVAGNVTPPPAEAIADSRRELAEAARPMMRAAPAPAAADAASGRMARSAPAASATTAEAPGGPRLWQDLIDQPADKWVQRILEWQRAGRAADAEALIREFRRRFPDQPLPAEIRQP